MTYLAVAVSLGLFVWSLKWSRAVESAGDAVAVARSAMAALLDATLSDEDKERAARQSSLRLFAYAGAILARLALALAVPLAFLALLVVVRLLTIDSVARVLESWEFLVASTLVIAAALLWRR